MILNCNNCGNPYSEEEYPVFLPYNPNGLCYRCNEKELCEYLSKELILAYDEIEKEIIRAEANKITSRFEILDL